MGRRPQFDLTQTGSQTFHRLSNLASPNGGVTPRFAQKFPPDTAYSAPPGSPTARPPQSPGEAPPVPSARGSKGCSRSPVQAVPLPAPQIDSLKAARRQEPER